MPFNVDKYLDALFVNDPALRNDDARVNQLVTAAALADIPAPAQNKPVQVQRVDTKNLRTGQVTTEWEVVDTRLPKRDRIVKTGIATEQLARADAAKRVIAGGAYTLEAVDADEYFHDTDLETLGNQHTYGVVSGGALSYDAGNMTVDVAAGNVLHNGTVVSVAATTDAYTLVADGSNERWAALCISSAGAAVLVSGDAAASSSTEPTKPEIGDRVLLGMAKIQAAQTVANNCEYKLDKRIMTHARGLSGQAFDFVELSGQKGFFALGPASAAATYADGDHVGLGFVVQEDATSAAVGSAGSPYLGAWSFATGATSGEDAGVIGPYRVYTDDWTLVWRGAIPSAADQAIFIGCRTTGGTFSDENGIIGFRVSGTGNIFGVCDSGGTETTRDSGATGATECTLRIEVRSAGTIVRFYKDNAQIGADVTTNIPTGTLITAAGIVNSTTADKPMYTWDLYGWREV